MTTPERVHVAALVTWVRARPVPDGVPPATAVRLVTGEGAGSLAGPGAC